jgi:short-subunit dehydrogenase
MAMELFPFEYFARRLDKTKSRSDSESEKTRLKPVILVTGASSGIGLALARKLWRALDYRVIITARKTSCLRFSSEQFQNNERFLIRSLDVTIQREREYLISEINDRWGGVDILINNAGVSYRSVLEHMSEAEMQAQLATNFIGPIELIRLVLPGMRAREYGHVINISSVGGMMAMPTMSAYSSSKFALEGATESLWYELRPWNIRVTLMQPGFINSESFKKVALSSEARKSEYNTDDPYHRYYTNMTKFVERMMRISLTTPENVADRIIRVVRTRSSDLRIAVTTDAVIFGFLRRVIPRRIYHLLLYHCLPGITTWRKR